MKNRNMFFLVIISGLLLSLFTFSPATKINAEEDSEAPLEYTDEVDEGAELITRTFTDFTIASIKETFLAPSGCVLTFAADDNAVSRLKKEIMNMDIFQDDTEIQMINVCAYRILNNSKMYSSSDTDWDISFDDFNSYITSKIASLEVYEIEDKVADVDISGLLEIEVYSGEGYYYKLVFNVATYHVKKYAPGDVLHLEVSYYFSDDEKRADIRTTYSDDLFNEKYGFKTDGREEKDWDPGSYYENYTIKYYDKATKVILGIESDKSDVYGVEIENISSDFFTVYAVMTFKQDGITYTYTSNEVEIGPQIVANETPEEGEISGLLVDGYDNRDTITVNEPCTLGIKTNFSYDNITSVSYVLCLFDADKNPIFVKNEDGEDVALEIVSKDIEPVYLDEYGTLDIISLSSDYFKFDFTFLTSYGNPGRYYICGDFRIDTDDTFYYNSSLCYPLNVVTEKQDYTPLEKALTLTGSTNSKESALNSTSAAEKTSQTVDIDISDVITCVTGGEAIYLNAFIAEDVLNTGETPVFTWSSSQDDVVKIDAEGNSATITPKKGGVVTIKVSVSADNFESLSKEVNIQVIDIFNLDKDIKDELIYIPDEFHYSGTDLSIGANVNNIKNVYGFYPDWKVTDASGNEVEFIDNGSSITLKNPVQDDYTVTLSYEGVELCTKTVEVRTINVDVYVKENIIWIALVTLGFMGAVIALKLILDKKGSLVKRIDKTNKKFEAIDKDSPLVVKELGKIKFSILSDIDYAKSLNMNALNEYEKTIRYLGKSLADIKNISKNKNTMSPEEYEDVYNKLRKDLLKAYNVAKEIEGAKEQSLSESLKANENNIVKLESERNKK